MQNSNRVVAITGGGQGLGRAIAVAFSRAGFGVAILGRTRAKLEETQKRLVGPSAAIVANLIDPDQVRAAFAQIARELGGLDALVNNAASYSPFAIEKASDEELHEVVNQSLFAPLYCIRESIPLIRKRGGGDIVNVSTQSVETPQPYMVAYAAAKAGMEAVSRGLRNELAGQPFRVMTIQLGVIADSVIDAKWESQKDAYMIAMQRAGMEHTFVFPGATPESIAASIVHAVTAPRDIYIQTIQVRGMGPVSG